MKIAFFCSAKNKIPVFKTGGTEQPIYYLLKELAKKGHDITLYAAKGSKVPGVKIKEISPIVTGQKRKNLYAQERIASFFDLKALADFFKYEADNFDIIQFNGYLFYQILPFTIFSNTPVIIRINYPHNFIYPYVKEELLKYKNNIYYLPISNFIKSSMPDLNYFDPIYPSLDFNDFKYSDKHKGYLLFVGRLCYDKGVHLAIEAAKKAGEKLIIAGRNDDEDLSYFNNFVKPYINDNIEYVGEIDFREKIALYRGAKATLFPILWNEPFGNVMIESMACGTPIIAFNRGACREAIKNNVSGLLVKDGNINKMAEAVNNINKISRKETREWAKSKFSNQIIIDSYEEVYRKILKNKK
jgi:glycosyltransferase involved in cell wall biosynthesis